ncbi:MAG: hypothetical protein AAFZ17_00945 [Cyanobacteria bacterium J06650_10]
MDAFSQDASSQGASSQNTRTHSFSDDMPIVISVHSKSDLPVLLADFDLNQAQPTLVLVGGASNLSEATYQQLEAFFAQVLVPLAERLNLYVVDGGTDVGIMRLMGQARARSQATFPLIGVAPHDLLDIPGSRSSAADAAPIEIHHTHCFTIPGNQWGDESLWIASIASHLSQNKPSVAVLINGGNVTWKDAAANVEANRSIVVVKGSGRAADSLAMAIEQSKQSTASLSQTPLNQTPPLIQTSTDERAIPLVRSGLLQILDLNQPFEKSLALLQGLLS